MYSNQISARDLFAGNQSNQDHGDAGRDFSQLQNAQFTQFEMTQQCSQDFFSQPDQYSTGSNPESQGRRVPTYEKYLSKPSLFKGSSQNKIPSGRLLANKPSAPSQPTSSQTRKITAPLNYQQQITQQKAKAKDRDERDMLSSIVSIVKECSNEVKQNIDSLREADHDSGEALNSSIKTLSTTVEEHSSKILKAIKLREDQNTTITNLNKQIRQKDETIQDLLRQLNDAGGNNGQDGTTAVLDAMKTFLTEQQTHTAQKLQRILECTNEHQKLLKDVGLCQRSGTEESSKNYMDLKYTNQRQVQDAEKRLLDELINLRDDFERQKRDMENFYRSHTQNHQQKHSRDIEQQIQRGIDNSVRQTKDTMDEIYRTKQSEMKDMCRTQSKDIEKYIKTHTTDQVKQLIKQSQDFFNKHHKELQKDMQKKLDDFKSQQKALMVDNSKYLETLQNNSDSIRNERPWQNDNVPKKVQEKLDELHNQHQSEIKRLETEMKNQRMVKQTSKESWKENDYSENHDIQSSKLQQNVYDLSSETRASKDKYQTNTKLTGALFQKSGFLSPRPLQTSAWNSRSIFGRVNPSPVATVLPQRNFNTATSLPSGQENVHAQSELEQYPLEQPSRQLRSRVRNNSLENTSMSQQEVYVNNEELRSQEISRNRDSSTDIVESQQNERDSTKNSKTRKRKGKKGKKGGKKKAKIVSPKQKFVKTYSKQSEDIDLYVSSNRGDSAREMKTMPATTSYATALPTNMSHFSANVQPARLTARANIQPARTVFDFNDELSPGPTLRKRRNSPAMFTGNSPSGGDMMMYNQSSFEDNSTNSSPSLSVTEVFIRRRVRCTERKTPDTRGLFEPSQRNAALPDFLSTPNLTELYNDGNGQLVNSVPEDKQTQQYKSVRRQGEKRKLCDFNTQAIQMMQCSQIRRAKYPI